MESGGWRFKGISIFKAYDDFPVDNGVRLDNGFVVNITWIVDTTFTRTITSINTTFGNPGFGDLLFAYTKGTYGEYATAESQTRHLFKTTDNQTYWEEWAVANTDTSAADYKDTYWVEGDMLYYSNYHRYGPIAGVGDDSVSHEVRKASWKTGWLLHLYYNWTDSAGTLIEEYEWQDVADIPSESSSVEPSVTSSEESSEDSGTPGFRLLPLFATMIIASALYRRRKRERKTR